MQRVKDDVPCDVPAEGLFLGFCCVWCHVTFERVLMRVKMVPWANAVASNLSAWLLGTTCTHTGVILRIVKADCHPVAIAQVVEH